MSNVNDMIQELRLLAYPQKSHKNAGRKPLPPELRSQARRYMTWLLPSLADALREIGAGSVSRGIETVYCYYQNERVS